MSERLAAPDVLRGIAIAGTFGTNIWVFADPRGPIGIIAGADDGWWADTALRAAANGKFLALLTLLFGVGVELQYRSAVRRGLRWPGRYLLRTAILFTEGLLHYLLVFEFDVLMGYAVAALPVAWLIGRSPRVRAVAAAAAGSAVVLIVGAVTVLTAGSTGADAPLPPYPATWAGQVHDRIVDAGLWRIELVVVVPSAVALFLAGAALLRAGVFDAAGTRLRHRLVVLGAAGAVLNVATTVAGPGWFVVERYLVAPLVALGLLGLVPELLFRLRAPAGPVRRGLTALGRTAMSCYVGQNLVAAVLFHAWGLGLATTFAALPAPVRTVAVAGTWAAVLVCSAVLASVWLRRFGRGPLELLTHRLLGVGVPADPTVRTGCRGGPGA
ncbi:DUF418 domain-containing protein [Pseudonocardia phyllosphaerae]|uniref:DUF418 domain-containing protein n=1 Tax=Pseudonocardia phyllosphaerae TaxID=3390502 RepID=UPI00397C54DC